MQSSNHASREPPNEKQAIWRKGPRGYLQESTHNHTTPGESGHGQIGLRNFGGRNQYEPEFLSDEVFISNNGKGTHGHKPKSGNLERTNERRKKLWEGI